MKGTEREPDLTHCVLGLPLGTQSLESSAIVALGLYLEKMLDQRLLSALACGKNAVIKLERHSGIGFIGQKGGMPGGDSTTPEPN